MINIIVAYDKNLAIGRDNTLVWRQSADLKRFKELTTGNTVVMGRKTFDSIGKPLPNRRNIVLTRQDIQIEGVEIIKSIEEIKNIEEDIFIIGGGEIYKSCLIFADRIFATEIDCEIEADTWFVDIDINDWIIESKSEHKSDEKNQYDYSFINLIKNEFKRRNN
jgi:dihydrofolate reductase